MKTVIEMARMAGFHVGDQFVAGASEDDLERFAQLVAAAKDAEHKEAMRWDVHTCGPTCKRYACVMTREAVAAEREACAKVCEQGLAIATSLSALDDMEMWGEKFAAAIRARGETK